MSDTFIRSTIFFHAKNNNLRGTTMPAAPDTSPDTAAHPRAGGLLHAPRRWLAALWRMLRSIG